MKNGRLKWVGIGTFLLVIVGVVVAMATLTPTREVRGKSPAIPLTEEISAERARSQDLALSDSRVQALTIGKRSEVFGIRDVGDHFPESSSACASAECYQVQIYNFDEDAAVIAIVNLDTDEVLDVFHQPGVHPGINKRLSDVALDIALNHPDVIAELGFKPEAVDMAPVDAGMVNTLCDEGHLCAGPTFNMGDRILWAIVDLTAENLAGLVWAPSDPTGSSVLFEPSGCVPSGSMNRDGWTLDYETTGTDGFRVYNVEYNGVEVANSIKTIEWHADYGGFGYVDSTGCGGSGGGFPIFPFGTTEVLALMEGRVVVGFEVVQDFRMGNWGNSCNYRYEQHMQFFNDGRWRVVTAAFGKGCGTDSLYRPVVRIDVDVDGANNDTYARYNGLTYVDQTVEEYWVPYTQLGHGPHQFSAEGYNATILDDNGTGYYMEMGQGQFGDNGRADDAFIYVTRHRASEGDTDLGVLGSCCNDDYRQGPDQYVNGESIDSTNIVLWYVPQSLTDVTPGDYYCWTVSGEPNPETYPCFSGPMFHPNIIAGDPPEADFSWSLPAVAGESVSFVNQSTGTEPIDYNWTFGDGSSDATEENPTHVFSNPGNYTVTLRAENAISFDIVEKQVSVVGVAPSADFDHNGPVTIGETASFTNQTTGTFPITYQWDFGDDSPISNAVSPTHDYTTVGNFTVVMTATNGWGIDTSEQVFTVNGNDAVASFTSNSPVIIGELATFTNTSTGTAPLSYEWDFGDDSGTTSATNPSHLYLEIGDYTVTLTTSNIFSSDTVQETFSVEGIAPVAGFEHDGPAIIDETVSFTSTSTGSSPLSYEWGFGDDSAASNAANPTHVYTEPGTYTVTLAVENEWGSDSAESTVVIDGIAPTASFENAEYAVAGITTVFTNTSTGTEPLSYEWDFGDGTDIDTSENPTHEYESEDTYTVVLTVTNPWGVDSAESTMEVVTLPIANFSHTMGDLHPEDEIDFVNGSTGTGPLSYEWDFGDGTGTSTDKDLTYAYEEPGVYTVTLTTTSLYGSDSKERAVTILGIAPTASFESAEYAIVDAATVFTNTSTGAEPLSYEWDFGDDTVIDDSENPTHVFTVEDTYTVVLTVTNPWGVDSAEMTISAYTTPSASFFFNPNAYYPGDDVAFTNGSNGTGPLSYEWDFGDGVGTSTDEDPTYAYAESGVYTVKLTTTSPYGSDSFERLVMIDWQQLLPIIMR